MTILLADDEKMVRVGLQSMLEELAPNRHVYLHARNGKDMLGKVQKEKPDVVFLDIKMPVMDGLEALSVGKEISPDTVWIILSGYANFEYARKALSLSAFDYLLKPIDIDILRKLMDSIQARIAEKRAKSNTKFFNDIVGSFNLADQLGPDEISFLPDRSGRYLIYQFYIDVYSHDAQHEIKQRLWNDLNDFCSQYGGSGNYCIFFNTSGCLCLVCSSFGRDGLDRLISGLLHTLPEHPVAVFSGEAATVQKIYRISRRIDDVSEIRIIKNSGKPMPVSAVEECPGLEQKLQFCRSMEDLSNAYCRNNMGTYRQLLSASRGDALMRRVFSEADAEVFRVYLNEIFSCRFQFKTYDAFLKEMEDRETVFQDFPRIHSTDVSKIKDFVYKNYMKDVSISYVSEQFGISPSYLSKLFHEQTGQKYIDFVTKVRVETAKRILTRDRNASVKEISNAVGYTSVRHFSTIFQKYTGELPSKYADSR